MHQLMQKCVRERMVQPALTRTAKNATSASECGEYESVPELTQATSSATSLAVECAAGAVSELRSVLAQRFQYKSDPSSWVQMRALAPCIERWHQLCTPDNGLSPDDREVGMLTSLGALMRLANGDLNSAGQICAKALKLGKEVLPADHPHIATSMNNLAATYGALGRHEEALRLKEETLAFRKRVLPADHPDIATSMNNLAATYGALGRHEEALRLQDETLAFRKRVLPADHPDIATSMGHLAYCHYQLGRTVEAERLLESALRVQLRALPPKHEDTQKTMEFLRVLRAGRGTARAPRSSTRVKPNAPCPCGSGRKYKKCCGTG